MHFNPFAGGPITKLIGHCIGILGAVLALDWIIGTVNPKLMAVFPIDPAAVRQLGAGLCACAMVVGGNWLVQKPAAARRRRAEPRDSVRRDEEGV